MKKSCFVTLLLTSFLSFNVCANPIHTVEIDVGASHCCAAFSLSTLVGHWQNGHCQFEAETPQKITSACEVFPFGEFNLDGSTLEQAIGNQWDCAATRLTASTFKADELDEFKLLRDADNHYVNTEPSNGEIHVDFCH